MWRLISQVSWVKGGAVSRLITGSSKLAGSAVVDAVAITICSGVSKWRPGADGGTSARLTFWRFVSDVIVNVLGL